MKKIFKKVLYALALAVFILTATNTILALHLAAHEKDKQHDHNNCPICQQAAINKKPIVLPYSTETFLVHVIVFTVSYDTGILLQATEFQLPQLRAPPSIS